MSRFLRPMSYAPGSCEGRQSAALKDGMMVVVPQNVWHQFQAPDGVRVMTTTPQPTQHLTVDVPDPRTVV
ncbi:MAG TPA: hypothetical protein VGM32_24575 [Rhodopila sp.]